MDRVKRASPAVTSRYKVEEATQQIAEEVNEGESLTCLGFPCMDTICLEHYTVEGDIRRTLGQEASAREEGHRRDRMKGDKTGRKYKQKGKSAVPERPCATNRTPGSYHGGPGLGQK